MRLRRRSGIALAILALALGWGTASAEIPSDVRQRIQALADDYRARAAYREQAAPASSNPVLARVLAENDRRIAEARMAAIVVGAITARPALAGELMRDVSATAPDLADGVRQRVTVAFPYYAAAAAPAPPAARRSTQPPAASRRSTPPPVTSRPSAARAAPAAVPSFGSPESAEDEEAAAVAELTAGAIAPPPNDPYETVNRAIFWFNDTLDQWIFRPIAWTYGKVMPEPGKRALRNVAQNLKGPVILANDLLQGEFTDASSTMARVLANTTLGVAGLFDVATAMGIEKHPADFGQTLHVYGVSQGPYIMLPFFGPSTVREGSGKVVDSFFDPMTYALEPTESVIAAVGKALIKRESVLDASDELRRTSLDYYAAVRSLYLQDRAVELRRGAPAESAGGPPAAAPRMNAGG